LADLHLVVENALAFNERTSDIYECAMELRAAFERALQDELTARHLVQDQGELLDFASIVDQLVKGMRVALLSLVCPGKRGFS
jgi:hypothetical protein